jgi:CheY-like chemotaxis protein
MTGAKSERPLVLVVDDDGGIREAATTFLEMEGFATLSASDGVEAFELLADLPAPPALILLDMMMPGMDGWMFCRLRQGIRMLKETPVVVMSTASVLELREPLRIDALLPKPFHPRELTWIATRLAGQPRRSLS